MKRTVIGATVLAVAVAGVSAVSAAPSQWKVTGGGQIIAASQQGGGPGQTLAFNAHSAPTDADTDAARGQLQYNSHAGSKFHGTVDCLVVGDVDHDGDESTPAVRAAALAGRYTAPDGAPKNFQLYVEDYDFGGPQNGVEALAFNPDAAENSCDIEDQEAGSELGRGNITIHKAKAADAGTAASGGKGKGKA